MSGRPTLAWQRRLYGWLIGFYPDKYRLRMQESMQQTFDDLCRENGANLKFLLAIFGDTLISVIKENLMTRQTNNKLALLSLLLLIPFTLVFAIAWIWQLLNWAGVASTPEVTALVPNVPVAYWLVFLAPAAAAILNASAITVGAVRVGPRAAFTMQFVKSNVLTLGALLLTAAVTIFIFGHDAIPCFVRGVLNGGWGNISPLFRACLNA